jgi:hypothetical protein
MTTDRTPEPTTDRTPEPTTEAGRQLVDEHMLDFYQENHSDYSQGAYEREAGIERAATERRVARIESEARVSLQARIADLEQTDKARRGALQLREALQRVADLHSPDLIGVGVEACCICGRSDEYPVDWPCETRQAADAALSATADSEGWRLEAGEALFSMAFAAAGRDHLDHGAEPFSSLVYCADVTCRARAVDLQCAIDAGIATMRPDDKWLLESGEA